MKTKLVLMVIFFWFVHLAILLPIDSLIPGTDNQDNPAFGTGTGPGGGGAGAGGDYEPTNCHWRNTLFASEYVCDEKLSSSTGMDGITQTTYANMESGNVILPFGINSIIVGFSGERGPWGGFLAFWASLTTVLTIVMGISFLPWIGSND